MSDISEFKPENEHSSQTEVDAKQQATLVLNQLIDALAKHFRIMRSQARAIIREALQEI
jgi:hypothetical protein